MPLSAVSMTPVLGPRCVLPPSTARMRPQSTAILGRFLEVCKRKCWAGSQGPRDASSESGVEFGKVLRLILERITLPWAVSERGAAREVRREPQVPQDTRPQ
jgi:hypothetical protein